MSGGRYRHLKSHECPDRRLGDQVQDIGNGYWIITEQKGEKTINQLGGGRYRRPRNLKPTDLSEETACFT